MSFTGITTQKKNRVVAGVGAACLFGGLAVATVAAPVASAQPAGCSASDLTGTVSSVTATARQYLDAHPGANQAVTAAMSQQRPEAEANLRGYFTANPGEYYDLRGILAPLGDAQRNCNVTVLPPDLQSAYNSFMAG
ncbi:heme-binding protein [Mycobacterium sp. 236(2023)]|uniref:heme-binding protein n=1 Tax=Mycobacterium sp. 236(2023) TaxID=3038163 RepID=UPI002414F01B|nr:heme-binding protein [Mycobacterium sp. 236(2023)]MDG4668442.1 heme-binding protein [Mycobacterium sp. 236(2023)]